MLALAAALLLLFVSTALAAGLRVKSLENPAQAPLGQTPLRFLVTDVAGAPVSGAQVSLELTLPAVPHVLPRNSVAMPTSEPGVYAAYVNLEQNGQWQVAVSAKAGGETVAEKLMVVAGTGQADHSVRRYVWLGVGALVVVIAGRILWLRRSAGES